MIGYTFCLQQFFKILLHYWGNDSKNGETSFMRGAFAPHDENLYSGTHLLLCYVVHVTKNYETMYC